MFCGYFQSKYVFIRLSRSLAVAYGSRCYWVCDAHLAHPEFTPLFARIFYSCLRQNKMRANVLKPYVTHSTYELVSLRAVFLKHFHLADPQVIHLLFAEPRMLSAMNKTIDGLHMDEIHKSFIHVNAHAKFF